MFRKSTPAGDPASETHPSETPVQRPAASTASTVAAIRSQQQQARRRTGDAAGAPSLAALGSSRATAHTARGRVQQAQGAASVNAGNNTSLRSRLLPLTAAGSQPQQTSAQGTASTATPGFASQLFSVFTNPLSFSPERQADAAAGANTNTNTSTSSSSGTRPSRSRAAASLPAAADSPKTQQTPLQQQENQHAEASGAAVACPAVAPGLSVQQAGADAAAQHTADTSITANHSITASTGAAAVKQQQQQEVAEKQLQQAYCFEVHAAASEPEQLIDYNGHDQQHSEGPEGQQQQHDDCIQHYVYDEDTGQLVRTGEGTEAARFGRHYLEDVHTGEFFPLTQQHSGGCWAWLRQRPRQALRSLFRADGQAQEGLRDEQQQQQQQEPGFLLGLSDFLDSVGSGMAALGLFAQGLAGGLALLCLFMTYIQYATAGRNGFLAFYSPQAEMINRTFFTLLSISLVAAASQNAYDKLGHFSPQHLRLGLVDCLVMLLYFLAYTCNLLATPLDDQLASLARNDPTFYTQPLPGGFERRLGVWHALNLIRVIACGLAWVLVCYRSNHFVMLKVFEARRAEQQVSLREGSAAGQHQHAMGHGTGGGGGAGGAAGPGQQHAAAAGGGAGKSPRRLQRLNGSNLGSFAAERGAAGAHGSSTQQQWAVHTKQRLGSSGGVV